MVKNAAHAPTKAPSAAPTTISSQFGFWLIIPITPSTRFSSRHGNSEPSHQRLQFLSQERKRRCNKQMVLHARWVVVGFDDHVGREWPARNFGRKERIGNLAGRGEDSGTEDFGFARLLDQADFETEPPEALPRQHLLAPLGRRDGFA